MPAQNFAWEKRAPWREKIVELFAIDLRSLALFRVALGVILLADLATRLQDLRGHYTDDGVWPRTLAVQELAKRHWYFSLHLLGGSTGFEAALFAVAALFALALALGFYTRVATVASWFLLVSLHTRNAAVLNCGDSLLALCLFWSMFLPLGARWSLDARRRKKPGAAQTVCSAATAALLLQICLVYWFTVVYKWDGIWAGSGEALRYALNLETVTRPLGAALLDWPRLLRAMTWGTLALEVAGPLLAFVPVATGFFRTLAALAFLIFHLVASALMFRIGLFPAVSAACWLVFLPAFFWEKILRRPRMDDAPGLRAPLPANVAAGALFLLVVLWNWRGVNKQRFAFCFPAMLDPAMYLLRLDQQWPMFASRGLSSEGWHVAPAILADGSQVELITGADYSEGEIERPRRLSDRFPDYRWGRYPMREINKSRAARFAAYADFLKREWNRTHPPERAVVRMEIYFMREINQIPRQTASAELFYSDALPPSSAQSSARSEDAPF